MLSISSLRILEFVTSHLSVGSWLTMNWISTLAVQGSCIFFWYSKLAKGNVMFYSSILCRWIWHPCNQPFGVQQGCVQLFLSAVLKRWIMNDEWMFMIMMNDEWWIINHEEAWWLVMMMMMRRRRRRRRQRRIMKFIWKVIVIHFLINFERTLPNYKHLLFTGSMAYPIPYHQHP